MVSPLRETRAPRLAAAIVTLLAAVSFWTVFDVAGAQAASTICAVPAVPASGTYDTLVVPAGESCRLDGLTIAVRRNLVLEPGTFLIGGGNQPTHLTVGASSSPTRRLRSSGA